MEVQLIDYTGAGAADPARHAANVLVFTKQTRLNMVPGLFAEIEAWPEDKIMAELQYMANTIPSSWEFVEYKFLINGVTRAFTHQFVRTRTGSYAQQTMRVLDVSGWEYGTGPTIPNDEQLAYHDGQMSANGRRFLTEEEYDRGVLYHQTMAAIANSYDTLIDLGAKIEDARGVLPTNILTSIAAKFDLRSMADTMRKRASSRTQGEYRKVMDAMKAEVLRVHPWAELFFNRTFDKAAADLEGRIINLQLMGHITKTEETELIKFIDQMRATA